MVEIASIYYILASAGIVIGIIYTFKEKYSLNFYEIFVNILDDIGSLIHGGSGFRLKYINLTTLDKKDTEDIGYILEIIKNNRKKVLIVGDVMLDHVMYCEVTGLEKSQKHNVDEDFTFTCKERTTMGGAAHVAYSCSTLSDVTLLGVIGTDSQGDKLIEVSKFELSDKGTADFYREKDFITTTKMYFDCSKKNATKQDKSTLIRFNREMSGNDGKKVIFKDALDEKKKLVGANHYLVQKFKDHIQNANCVVFKDHQKGFLSNEYLKTIIPIVNEKINSDPENFFVFIDPKYDWDKFGDLTKIDAILPNIKEAAAGIFPIDTQQGKKEIKKREMMQSLKKSDLKELSYKFSRSVQCFGITKGKNGAILFRSSNSTVLSVPAVLSNKESERSEIGCGDVFDAYFIACMMNKEILIAKFGEEQFYYYSLRLANQAAGLANETCISEIIKPEKVCSAVSCRKN
jgi:D-beta-D-heptose 7-phosphate kinase/D-beta-D-heptose 1-phosphate adenosyltransferase